MELLKRGIIFKPTDKNLGSILLDLATYLALGHKLVDDTTTYSPATPPTLEAAFTSLKNILAPFKLDKAILKYLLQMEHIQTTLTAAILYILPKVHKLILEGRPIVSNSNFFTFYPSKYLHHLLRPLLQNIPTHITSSTHLITILNNTHVSPDDVLCSFDVTSLYPSIPIDAGLAALKLTMEQAHWLPAKIDFVIALANWVLTNSYVTSNYRNYKQVKGTAMGTPFAVTYAEIFMHQHERKALAMFFLRFMHHPTLIKRLIDDFLAIVRNTEEAVYLKECLNHSDIIITGGHSHTSVDFLDITLFKGPHLYTHGTLDTTLFQKPMNTYGYITFTSFHQPHVFTNFIKGELRRFAITCSIPSHYTSSCTIFRTRLLDRNYPSHFIDHIINTTSFDRDSLLRQAAHKISQLYVNPACMIDPHDIQPIRIHIPHSTRTLPISSIDILQTLPDYILTDPLGRLIFNELQPFQFTTLQAPSNLGLLVRSDTIAFYNKHNPQSQPTPSQQPL